MKKLLLTLAALSIASAAYADDVFKFDKNYLRLEAAEQGGGGASGWFKTATSSDAKDVDLLEIKAKKDVWLESHFMENEKDKGTGLVAGFDTLTAGQKKEYAYGNAGSGAEWRIFCIDPTTGMEVKCKDYISADDDEDGEDDEKYGALNMERQSKSAFGRLKSKLFGGDEEQ